MNAGITHFHSCCTLAAKVLLNFMQFAWARFFVFRVYWVGVLDFGGICLGSVIDSEFHS
jgi:hypothetical protein